jgi:hypothetical protein
VVQLGATQQRDTIIMKTAQKFNAETHIGWLRNPLNSRAALFQGFLALIRGEQRARKPHVEHGGSSFSTIRSPEPALQHSSYENSFQRGANIKLHLRSQKNDEITDIACGVKPFKDLQGACAKKVIVLSSPKAGTYLMGGILENLGLTDLEIHLGTSVLTDYRYKSNREKIETAWRLERPIPLDVSASLILPGQFAVGHIPFEPWTYDLLRGFVRILGIRELRSSLVSWVRFEYRRLKADPERNPGNRSWVSEDWGTPIMRAFLAAEGAWFLDIVRSVYGWFKEPNTLVFRFEELLGDFGVDAQQRIVARICTALGLNVEMGYPALMKTLGSETQTFSGQRSNLGPFWDACVEDDFRRLGGIELNALLGYGD